METPVIDMSSRRQRLSRWYVVYLLVVLGGLLGGWEMLARGYDAPTAPAGPVGQTTTPMPAARTEVFVDTTRNDDLLRTVQNLPAARPPRILVLGSSQIATVKHGPGTRSMPYVLAEAVTDEIGHCQIVDLSAGGQQVVESLIVLTGSFADVAPDAVVLGVGAFSMQRTVPRPTITRAFGAEEILSQMKAATAPGSVPETLAAVLETGRTPAAAESEPSRSIVQRVDGWALDGLEGSLDMVANRRAMYNRLIDTPIRRDLVAEYRRRVAGVTIARTYDLTAQYGPSLDALDVMAKFCRLRRVPLLVVILPYDHTRTPVPYAPETARKLHADLAAHAAELNFDLQDLSDALGSDAFGVYSDQSPDGFHYTPQGHKTLGHRIAKKLLPLLDQRGERKGN